ncbi:MAG: asparagine synthase (glutamine-hydrolyzing) [Desulfobacteraceae bacterium]|nr:asparagine synthase (glutamine-hydrolyzing) [Desulfobacteraceae bacterium]
MCGIYGVISPGLSHERVGNQLALMGKILHHRGPDDQKNMVCSFAGNTLGLGFVRLSILDLDTGMQPIRCGIDDATILCNGQIYNYIELKELVKHEPFMTNGDVEVALHLYRLKGVDFLSFLNGMYAGVIFDPRQSRLLLFRDRFGIKPLYYAPLRDGFVFASEIKPLLAGCDIPKELNRERLSAFFTYRYVPGNDTLFAGIHRVPPGAFLDYDFKTGKYQIHRYWDYRLDRIFSKLSLEDAADQFYALFSDAVRIRLRSDVEVGSLISGGIDSSAVAVEAAKRQPLIRLFTIGFEADKYDELPQVKIFLSAKSDVLRRARLNFQICRESHLNRLPHIVRSLEEPVSLGTLLPTDLVCEMAAQQVKVVLTGEGADEIFAGYRKFMIEAAASQFDNLPGGVQRDLLARFPELHFYKAQRKTAAAERYIQNEALFSSSELGRLIGIQPSSSLFSNDAKPFLTGLEDPLNEMIAYETRFRLPDYVILRLDRLSMRHSLEARTPLLDYRLAEFAATLPVAFKANLEIAREKFICSHAYLQYHVLDRNTAYRRKQPFTIPLADWLSTPANLPDFLQEILRGELIRQQGIIDPKFSKSLVKKVTTQGIGPETLVSAADRVFAIIIFTLWYQAFFS